MYPTITDISSCQMDEFTNFAVAPLGKQAGEPPVPRFTLKSNVRNLTNTTEQRIAPRIRLLPVSGSRSRGLETCPKSNFPGSMVSTIAKRVLVVKNRAPRLRCDNILGSLAITRQPLCRIVPTGNTQPAHAHGAGQRHRYRRDLVFHEWLGKTRRSPLGTY
jgi:hypothetical protein